MVPTADIHDPKVWSDISTISLYKLGGGGVFDWHARPPMIDQYSWLRIGCIYSYVSEATEPASDTARHKPKSDVTEGDTFVFISIISLSLCSYSKRELNITFLQLWTYLSSMKCNKNSISMKKKLYT